MSKLKEFRKNSGLSQSKLANLSGVPIKTIQKYEQDERDITKAQVTTVLKLCRALGIKVEDLFTE